MLRAMFRTVCAKSKTMLAGSLLTLGLPNVWSGLSDRDTYVPEALASTIGTGGLWGALLLVAGLLLLALSLLRSNDNPYGYFAFGGLLSLVVIGVDFALPFSSYVLLPLLLAGYAAALLWGCRRPAPDAR